MIETIDIFGRSASLYFIWWTVGMIAAFAVGMFVRKQYGLSDAKAIIYISLDMLIGTFLIYALAWVFGGGTIKSSNYVRMVVWIGAYGWLLAKLFHDPYEKIQDFLMLIGSFLFGFARIGCIFPGCCHGYPSSWGLYSNEAGTVCFPIQIIEITVSFTLALILWHMHTKERFQGKLYPWFLVMFGSTRFVLEFFRDNHKLFWGISELALHALSCLIVGAVILTLSRKKQRKEVSL